MSEIKLKQGYDIRLAGEADREIVNAAPPARVAVKPVEFRGIKARPAVAEGDLVKIGSPLFHVKGNEALFVSSPASGKVVAVNRGHRRALDSIVVEPDGEQVAETFTAHGLDAIAALPRETVLKQVMEAGLLGVFLQRPFGKMPDPEIIPRDIFVTGFSSAPLAPDSALLVQQYESQFRAGLYAASRLTSGNVHLSIDGRARNQGSLFVDHDGVKVHTFRGPHPSGNVGVQIHHISPIRHRRDVVWTANVQDMIMLGSLFLEGRINPSRVVALVGTGATERKYFRTTLGAEIATLTQGRVIEQEVRYIAGDVLSGRKESAKSFIGYHDLMLTVIPEAIDPEFVGWMLPGFKKESFYRAFVGHMLPGQRFNKDTRLGGGYRAMVATGYYEQVLPMDIYPQFLIKSILADDFDEMEGLGIYELLEEDIALCEYVCPSKTEMQHILRQGLDLVEKEG